MAATYVTEAELRSNLSIGSLYTSATVEEVCQTAQDLIEKYLWHNECPVVASMVQNNVATLMLASPGMFTTGQQITITNCGSPYNGTNTITGTFPYTTGTTNLLPAIYWNWATNNFPNGYSFVQFAEAAADENFHLILPYGNARGPEHKSQAYSATPAIREAAMIVAVDIWQARQVSQTGGVGMDGITASPYRMGYQLINRVRGLIQPYSSPASLVG